MSDTPPAASTPGEFSAASITTIGTLLSGLDRLDPILQLPEYPAAVEPGVPFGGFLLRARLGEGSYGIVVLADDTRIGRRVVVKVPRPVVLTDSEARERFVREARAAGVLDHPNVVPVYEAGDVGGLPYLAAGFVDGPTLAARLARQPGPLPPTEAASLIRDLARAVHHAHERGVLHCDLKPANVLLQASAGRSEPMVTDFGMARILTDDPSLTRTRQQAGTPLYMSPEQARGDRRALTARSDVYALGAILFELLTGRTPHTGVDGIELATRIANDPVLCPRKLNAAVERDLRAVCLKCLAKEPGDRYSSAAALAADLDRYLEGRPVTARPVSMVVRVCRWVRRQPAVAAALLIAVAVTATAVGIAVERWVGFVNSQASLTVEKAEREAAQERARAEAAEKALAETRANTAEIAVSLERMERKRLARSAGWLDSNLAEVGRLLRLHPSGSQMTQLRSEAALALGGIDLREPRVIAPGFRAYAPAFRPDGPHQIALGSKDRTGGMCEVRIIDTTTGEEVRRLKYQHDFFWELRNDKIGYDGCRSISYSFFGDWLVVGTRSGWLVRWDLREKDPQPIHWRHDPESANSRKGQNTSVMPLAFDGWDCLWSGNGRDVARWDPRKGWKEVSRIAEKEPLTLGRSGGPAFTRGNPKPPADRWPTAFALDEDLGARAENGNGRRIELIDRKLVGQMGTLALPDSANTDDDGVDELLFNWDGTVLATAATQAQHLKLWDPISGRLLAARTLSPDSDVRLSFGSNYHRLLAATDAKGTLLYTYRRSRVSDACGLRPCMIEDADVTPNSWFLVTTSPTPAGGTELNLTNIANFPLAGRYLEFHAVDQVPGQGQPRLAAVSADGQYFATVLNNALRIWDTRVRKMVGGAQVGLTRALSYAPSGELWLLSKNSLTRWSPEMPLDVASPTELTALSVSETGVLLGRIDGSLCRYQPGGVIEVIARLGREPIKSIARDGDTTVVGTADGGVFVLRGGREATSLPNAHAGVVTTATVNPSGWFATGGEDKVVRVWNPEGKLVLTLPQTGKVRRLFWRPYGKMVILVEGERALRVWHMDELKKELAALGTDPALP